MPDGKRDPILRTIPQPADMNGNGDIFGGWVLSQMDMAGGAPAARAAEGRVAAGGVTAETVVEPIKGGGLGSVFLRGTQGGRTPVTHPPEKGGGGRAGP